MSGGGARAFSPAEDELSARPLPVIGQIENHRLVQDYHTGTPALAAPSRTYRPDTRRRAFSLSAPSPPPAPPNPFLINAREMSATSGLSRRLSEFYASVGGFAFVPPLRSNVSHFQPLGSFASIRHSAYRFGFIIPSYLRRNGLRLTRESYITSDSPPRIPEEKFLHFEAYKSGKTFLRIFLKSSLLGRSA
ncbi:Hypothetical protein NTJ_07780 [Nesidiocoris tenuis]|uniref:Uncharacterized protein n=1 Tax=Nesidiocoris tenuis TaxID=355587 RepID=A0ABN7ARY6_9HEMI|nr:Hypothetical protein NTJ_07780 [Nesidiocoris tenuis]